MSVKLVSLSYARKGPQGWSAGPYSFADGLTVLEGPNGAGKTPMLKGIAFALGHPVQLPPDILVHCNEVILELQRDAELIRIERKLGSEDSISVTIGEDSQRYRNLKDFSARICELFGIPSRLLATKNSGVTGLYMAFLLPMFWIDQDTGWKDLYSPLQAQHFAKDQAEEVIRLFLGLPGRNRPTDKNEYAAAVTRYEVAKQRADIKREVVSSLEKALAAFGPVLPAADLQRRKQALATEIRSRSSVLEVISQKGSALDEVISERRRERDRAEFAFRSSVRRLEELRAYGSTLTIQVSIVETNEIAADAFRTLCGNRACEFFRRPEESYGRRVLYIKDQLKDFETSMALLKRDSERLSDVRAAADLALTRSMTEKATKLEDDSGGQIVEELDRLTREFASASSQLLETERFETENEEFKKLINLMIVAEEAMKQLKPTRGLGREASSDWDAASEMGQLFTSWLTTLGTPNAPKQIWFDDHFYLMMDGTRFTEDAAFSGSTRTRIVLAFHAALIELSLKRGGSHPRFLILDTPKQHELYSGDLQAFVKRFMSLRLTYATELQLIVAATELEFLEGAEEPSIWHPFFLTASGVRFLGQHLPALNPSGGSV